MIIGKKCFGCKHGTMKEPSTNPNINKNTDPPCKINAMDNYDFDSNECSKYEPRKTQPPQAETKE
jgi:hypothetical protein